jgi:murein DD-endopeptidase MepM/ murein hydrolase activator NlpD
VYSVRPGIVELVTRNHEHDNGMGGYGNGVVLYHPDDDLWSFYAHLQRVEVAVGDVVVAGQRIGRVGNTSNGRFRGMAVHLHLEVRQRTAEGLSPFPGLYGPNNRDPEAWLARHGLHYDADGRPRANEQRLAGNNNAEIPQPEPPEANGDGRAEVLNRARPRQRPN